MKPGLSTILFLLMFFPLGLFGQSIIGSTTPCVGYGGYVYVTQQFMSNYTWTVSSGGSVTAGGSSTDYSITILWNTEGSQSVSVTYEGGSGPGVLDVMVQPTFQVSSTVVPSSNPVCAGQPVTFAANVINGGTLPVYSWFVNSVNVGVNNPTYTYSPATNDAVHCEVLSNLTCTSGNPATSPPVIMTVNPNLPVNVLVLASSNPSCEGDPVIFTASPNNGGPSPEYQWSINGNPISGATNSSYSYMPGNADIVVCQLTSSLSCTTGNPVSSSPMTMSVSQNLPVEISITASSNPACIGSQVVYTAAPVNGGASPGFSWMVNGINTGTNNPVMTWIPANGDIVKCNLNSSVVCKTGNPASSNEIIMVVEPYQQVNVGISASENPVCNGTLVTFTATPSNGGITPHYQWTVNGVSIVHDQPVYSYTPTNGDIVLCYLTSDLLCATGNPATSNPVTMTVSPVIISSVTITASANPTCAGTPITYTAHPVNPGTNPIFEWLVNGVSSGSAIALTFTPVNGDVIVCKMTSSAMCSQGLPVFSNTITMTVSPALPVSISISVSVNPVCQGTAVVFTAIPVNGGLSPVYEWKVNGLPSGSNNFTFTHTPLDGDVITCSLTSSFSCAISNPAISNAITMAVSLSLPVSIEIVANPNPACQGQSVTYTATGINGGASPVYTWLVNGVTSGSTSSTYSYIPTNGDLIKCYLNSSFPCASGNPSLSNQITMIVSPILPISVVISTLNNPSCQGSLVTYSATSINGGSDPGYQWRVNGSNAGTSSSTFSFVPSNTNIIDCKLTSSVTCPLVNPVISNAITQTVNPILPAGISISASANPVCTGTQVTFTATPVNGGSSPTFQWKRNGSPAGTGPMMIYTPSNGDVLTCTLTSNLMCVSGNQITSNPITMVVNSVLIPAITIVATENPFCQGSTVFFNSTISNGGNSPVYQWQKNGITSGTGSSYSYVPLDGDYITCRITSSLGCASPNPVTSNPILMIKNQSTPVSVSIAVSENPVCSGSTVTFTAIPANGGPAPSYQWKVNGINQGGNSAAFTYFPVIGGEIVTCTIISNAVCASGNPAVSNSITLVTSTSPTPGIVISTLTNPFCAGTSVAFSAISTNGGSSPTYLWKVNNLPVGSNSSMFTYSALNGDIVTCQMTSSAACIAGTVVVSDPPITMVASDNLPLGIMITESANPVCQGTAVHYTATPVNGGANPYYQWKVNSVNKGTNSPVFVYVPVNTDAVTCKLTTSLVCASPQQKTSDPINMTVEQSQPVGISIAASSNPVCQGSSVTLTATSTNGGSSPIYIWRVNGVNTGATGPLYSYTPSNGDVVTATLISNAYCVSGNPAVSNSVALVVGSEQPVTITISASENPFCTGSQIIYQAIPTNGGPNPVYEWRVNGIVKGTNNPIFQYSPVAGDQITCVLTSNQTCVSNNPATSNTINMVVTTMMPVGVTITASNTTLCAGTLIQFTATVANGGTSPAYSWKVNGISKGTNFPIYQYPPVNGDVVTCIVTSNLTCATNNPATSNAITLTVIPSAPVSISIVESSNPCCQGTSVTYTATATNAGTDPLYRWKVNGTIILGSGSPVFTYIPINGDVVLCRLTSDHECATNNPANSNSIIMNVLPYGVIGVSITASGNPVCQGTQVTYTATPDNGGSAPSYQWKVNGLNAGNNSASFSYTPVQGDVIVCVMTSNATCVLDNTTTSNPITMTVSPLLPVSVYIVSSSNPVCQGTVTFNATPGNGGPFPVYQWKVNGGNAGTNNPVFTYAPADGEVVQCAMTSNAACIQGNPANSNEVTLSVVQSMPVSVTVTPSSMPSCQGETITFTATPVNGGTNPLYQWMINGIFAGGNFPIYTYTPNNGDVIECQVTSSIACPTGNPAVSLPLVMNFSPVLPVGISILCSANPACQGPQVQFTALIVNAGPAPDFQWKVNGIDMGVNLPQFSYLPANGDAVVCTLNADIPCPLINPVTSNAVTMSVLPPQTAGITIYSSGNTVCAGTLVTFTSTSFNQGLAPVYTWKVNGIPAGTNSSSFAYLPANGDQVTCQLTSSVSCITNNPVTSNSMTMMVSTEFPVSVTIVASQNPSCLGENVTLTATGINGGLNPGYQWMVNGINVGFNIPTYTTTPALGQIISCQFVSGYSCATGSPAASNQIEMIVNPILPVDVSVVSSLNPACLGTTVTYTATVTNGGSTPVYHWKVNGGSVGGSSNSLSYLPNNNDVVVCEATSSEQCVSGNPANSDPITMIISSSFNAAVTIIASDNPICVNTPVTFTATPVFGGPTPHYQWKVNGIDVGTDSPVYGYYPNNGDVVTCIMTSALTCAPIPVASNPITMIVLPVPVGISITANPATAVCSGNPVSFTAFPVNGGPGPTFQWKVNGIQVGTNSPSYIYSPAIGDAVLCMLMSNATCATGSTAVSNVIYPEVNPLLPVSISITASENSICNGTMVTCSAVVVNGGTAPAYQWMLNGTIVNGATNTTYSVIPGNNDAIICELASNAICPTGNPATSNTVTMIVNPLEPVSVSVTATANPICAGTSVTYTAVPTNGGSIPSFQWKLNGAILIGATNTTYSYIPIDNDAITCELTSNAVCPTGNPATSNESIMLVNPLLAVSVTITANPAGDFCAGTSVTFNASGVNGGSNPLYQWTINGAVAGGNSPIYNYYPTNGDIVQCKLTSNGLCVQGNPALSNIITNTVNLSFPVGISIVSNPPGAVCYGIPVAFNATPVNGGTTPHFQWKVNGLNVGLDLPAYSYIPENNDVVTCQLMSNLLCATGNPALSDPFNVSVATTPVVTYTACHDMVTAINAKPFRLHGGLPLGGVYSGQGVNSLTGVFDPLLAGIGSHQITYTYTNSGLCIASNFVTIINQAATPFVCGNSIIDNRDSRIYPTVPIGTQCWMASNLNFGNLINYTISQVDNCIVEKYCLNDSEANCTQFGGRYQWDELMRYDSGLGGQGLCPPGWHVPTDSEWLILFSFYGGQSVAGTLLKLQGSGNFEAFLSGVIYQNNTWSFSPPGFSAIIFWTSEPVGQWQVKSHGLNNITGSVSDYYSARGNGFAVRCLLD